MLAKSRFCLLFALVAAIGSAEEPVDLLAVGKIKQEAFQRSQAMSVASTISDHFGPRLTGSPELKAANAWCKDKMSSWGLANARLESWGTIPRGWQVKRYSAEMHAPTYMRLNAIPQAWTPGTKGVSGTPMLVQIQSPADFDKYKGKLKGAIVMNGRPSTAGPRFEAEARRWTEPDLLKEASALHPGDPMSFADENIGWADYLKGMDTVTRFFSEEGVAALITPNEGAIGHVNVTAQSYTLDNPFCTFPSFVMAAEHYGRIVRLLEGGVPVQVELSSDAGFVAGPVEEFNVLADIPGTDPLLKDEVVLIGGHLDSWHAATGATDNAAGCAAVMEAARILKATGLRLKRTVRVALWTGEEQDYYGSVGYVRKHHGDPLTGKPKPDAEKLAAYFNLDNGGGKIRGIYCQSNEVIRPVFEAWFKPFHYLDAKTVTAKNTGGTDHMPFNALGLPAFQFIQDPLAYETKTHHTTLDVVEELVEQDLMQAAAIIASFAYHAANRAERLN